MCLAISIEIHPQPACLTRYCKYSIVLEKICSKVEGANFFEAPTKGKPPHMKIKDGGKGQN